MTVLQVCFNVGNIKPLRVSWEYATALHCRFSFDSSELSSAFRQLIIHWKAEFPRLSVLHHLLVFHVSKNFLQFTFCLFHHAFKSQGWIFWHSLDVYLIFYESGRNICSLPSFRNFLHLPCHFKHDHECPWTSVCLICTILPELQFDFWEGQHFTGRFGPVLWLMGQRDPQTHTPGKGEGGKGER